MYVTYTIDYGKPTLYVVENGTSRIDPSFEPYFYIKKEDYDKALPILNANKTKIKRVDDEPYYTSFPDSKPLLKIITNIPTHVAEIREELHKANILTYEADVLFHNRYIIDKALRPQTINNILYLDIEVLPPEDGSFPSPKKAEQPIITITCFSTTLNKYISFYWRHDLEPKAIKENTYSYYQFSNEPEMLTTFLNFIQSTWPEVIVGWNVNDFDLTYLYNRLKKLYIPATKLSPIGDVRGDSYEGVSIKGIWGYDLLKSYMKFKDLKFYPSLDYAAKAEGLPHKLEIDIRKAWEENIKELLEYNKRDVEITKLIDEKYKLLYSDLLWHYLPISQGVQLDDAMVTNKLADFILLKYAKVKGFALPSKIRKQGETIKGAVVYATPGLYKNVAVFDFKSMYPNIVKWFNIGADTKIPVEKECELCEKNCGDENWVHTLDNHLITAKELREQKLRCMSFSNPQILTLPNGVKFWKREVRQTIMAELIDELLNLRQKYKDEMKEVLAKEKKKTEYYKILDRKQTCIKYFTNAFAYGVSAYPNFRLFDIEVGNSIPTMGRELNLIVKEEAERLGYTVVLGDTDSIFVLIKSIEEAKGLCEHLNNHINSYLSEKYGVEGKFVLEFEKVFSTLLVVAKKRYAGYLCWKDGVRLDNEFTYKGIELKRQNTPSFAKGFQENLIKMILNSDLETYNYSKSLENKGLTNDEKDKLISEFKKKKSKEILNYIEELKQKIRSGEYSLNDLGNPGNLSRPMTAYKGNSEHVAAVRYSNRYLGYDIGEKEKFLYTRFRRVPQGYPMPPRGWVAWKEEKPLPKGFVPDYDYIITTWVDGMAKRILEPAGIGVIKYYSITDFL